MHVVGRVTDTDVPILMFGAVKQGQPSQLRRNAMAWCDTLRLERWTRLHMAVKESVRVENIKSSSTASTLPCFLTRALSVWIETPSSSLSLSESSASASRGGRRPLITTIPRMLGNVISC
jgi:hypothetical protein